MTADAELEWVRCALCGADDATPVITAGDKLLGGGEVFRMVRCRRCGLMYLNPRPTEAALGRYYPDSLSFYRPDSHCFGRVLTQRLARWRARRLSRYVPRGGSVLEIGCGTGQLLGALRNCIGGPALGVEMSAAGAATARDLFGLEVIQGSFPGVPLPSDQFDLVVLAHVLEHLPEPREALREVARVLKPGGVFYCMIPNYESLATRALGADWPGFDLPRHLYCYSPATVSKLMSECGLRVERVDHSAVPNDWVGALRLRLVRTPRLRWLARAAHLSSPIALLGCLPLSFLAATCKRAGKICVTARRDGDDARMEGS